MIVRLRLFKLFFFLGDVVMVEGLIIFDFFEFIDVGLNIFLFFGL